MEIRSKRDLYDAVDQLRTLLGVPHTARAVDFQKIVCASTDTVVQLASFKTRGLQGMAILGTPDIILLNERRGRLSQRFDFAHELIHCRYHRFNRSAFTCTGFSPRDPFLEWQANEGAAELLVPYRSFVPLVAENYHRIRRYRNLEAFIAFAAHQFQVTRETIHIRLKSLSAELFQYRAGIPLDQLEILSAREIARRNIMFSDIFSDAKRLEHNARITIFYARLGLSQEAVSRELLDEPYSYFPFTHNEVKGGSTLGAKEKTV